MLEYGRKENGRKENYESQEDFQRIFRKNAYLICPDNTIFHAHNDGQGTKVYQSLKENLTNITLLGSKETSVTAASIIAKSFEFNYCRKLMEEQFI